MGTAAARRTVMTLALKVANTTLLLLGHAPEAAVAAGTVWAEKPEWAGQGKGRKQAQKERGNDNDGPGKSGSHLTRRSPPAW